MLSNQVQALIESNKRLLIDFTHLDLLLHPSKLLGKGGFSFVYSAKLNGQPVAVKFFSRMGELTPKLVDMYARETRITAAVQHPSIIKFHGLCVQPPCIFIVLELAKGSLQDLLSTRRPGQWTFAGIVKCCIDVCNPIAHLHKLGYIHRDIKSMNYLVGMDNRVKLADFGLSRLFQLHSKVGAVLSDEEIEAKLNEAPEDKDLIDLTRGVGTRHWMSPEMLAKEKYTAATDVYSLAIVCWEVLNYHDVLVSICEYEMISSLNSYQTK